MNRCATKSIYHRLRIPKGVQHYLNAISLKIEASLLTDDGPPEYSLDLERAPGAHLIADEFSGGPSIANELHAAPFGIRSRQGSSNQRYQRPETAVVASFERYTSAAHGDFECMARTGESDRREAFRSST